MTQPDEWTEQDTAALGDLAYSKLEAECERLQDENESLRAELAEADVETEAAQNALIHLEDAMNGESVLDEAERAQAEVARLRVVLRDLDAMSRNFNAGWDSVTGNSGQDAAGG